MNKIPKELKITSFKDFCIRCEDLYDLFWEEFAPFFDIAIYRDYLLENVLFSPNFDRQEMLAGKCWEFLMGDIDRNDLYVVLAIVRREK